MALSAFDGAAVGQRDLQMQASAIVEVSPAIHIEKHTNGEDADLATGPSVLVGSTVTWTYYVTNTGDVPLSNILVTDSEIGTPDPVYEVTNTYNIGDTNKDGKLDLDETWQYQASGTAAAGQYQNTGTATGDFGSATVSDDDVSHYFGGVPEIHIEKKTNGIDADTQPGPIVAIGAAITWTYEVTNIGNLPIYNIIVTDADLNITPVYQSGDVNDDDILDLSETWIYQASGTAVAGQHENVGTVDGTDANSTPVSDNDPSHYFAPDPKIEIRKTTNGEDANTPTGPNILVGDPVTWRYLVTNIGNVPLTSINVTDSETGVTPYQLIDASGYNIGDVNQNNILDVGEAWTYEATDIAAPGQYANTGTAQGQYNSTPVTDTDESHYFGGNPGIHIEKLVNGEDIDHPGPGLCVCIPVGSTITWTYVVTNIGNIPISSVTVVDDQGLTPVSVDNNPADGYNDGDTNTDNLLDTDEIWVYEASSVAQEGQHTNIATATGTANGTDVSDQDPGNYNGFIAAIDIEKHTNGEDADTPPGPSINFGQPVIWQYIVTNEGNVPLENIVITDSDPTVTILYHTGDVNEDGILDVGETWLYEAQGVAIAGLYSNTGTASGQYEGVPAEDEDPSNYTGTKPTMITLVSLTASVADGQVNISWMTETEVNNAGFNIYRSAAANGEYVKINSDLIAGQGTATSGSSYSYTDRPEQAGTYYYKLQDVSIDGQTIFHGPVQVAGVTSVDKEFATPPDEYQLSQNHPNPFNPETHIQFAIPTAGHVSLNVYDIQGKLIRSLVNARKSAGTYSVTWDSRDNNGIKLTSGVYFYRISSNDFIMTRKMILMK
jgi:uncharacterized repeat protein (TIGR01451 family)